MIPSPARPLIRWLLPSLDEGEGFSQENLTTAHRGLRYLAAVETAIGLAGLLGLLPPFHAAVILAAGIGSATSVRVSRLYAHNRAIGVLCAAAAGLAAGWGLTISGDTDFALVAPVLLMLAAVATLPLLPLQTLAIGTAVLAGAWQCDHRIFLIVLVASATAISAALYAQSRTHYESYLSVLQATEEFRSLQARLLLAENSTTMVRLSAALAHELSQPVGTVGSGIDTLLVLSTRVFSATTPQQQERLISLQQDLARSLKGSLERLRMMVNRIQRLTCLDEAGTRMASINSLLEETAALVAIQQHAELRLEMQLQPVPEFQCRPQQLIAVFSVLLTNSIQATGGVGRISISTGVDAGRVRISISDNGRGIPSDRLAHIFQPGFQVTDGRVATGNWSLFTSRQFIRDHGGEMRIQSREGEGTTVLLFLPC
ncbi:MAG: HAMP domain-containing sensor histidine kinase [Bryobacteraceae bacterium]|nr:HAMP domain-containing sensor histidine kinase [Bryobacteraceae bacterium]